MQLRYQRGEDYCVYRSTHHKAQKKQKPTPSPLNAFSTQGRKKILPHIRIPRSCRPPVRLLTFRQGPDAVSYNQRKKQNQTNSNNYRPEGPVMKQFPNLTRYLAFLRPMHQMKPVFNRNSSHSLTSFLVCTLILHGLFQNSLFFSLCPFTTKAKYCILYN